MAYKPLNTEQIQELQQQSDDVYKNKLTKGSRFSELEAINEYTDGAYKRINPFLYGETPRSPIERKVCEEDIKLIDSAISKFQLNHDLVVVYSGTDAHHYMSWKVGDEKEIKAYLSTSAKESIAKSFYYNTAEPLIIEIRVPKGTKCLYIGNNTKYKTKQAELLLGRGIRYKVIERKKNRMVLEVLP